MAKKSKGIEICVGTKKGGFVLRSDDKRKNWKIDGPFFAGSEVTFLYRDPHSNNLWSCTQNGWFGPDLQVSRNHGKTWEKANKGIEFAPERKLNMARVWRIQADRAERPDTLWVGVDPGVLFRTDDGGKNWYEVTGLSQHPTHEKWSPGGGGMMVHHILPDKFHPNRVYVGVSVGGVYRSDDDGKTWRPMNKGVLADFQPDTYPEFGQCTHSMVASPTKPDLLFQQNHCGVYRTDDAGGTWQDMCKGLPSRFGFPMAILRQEEQTIFVIPENGPERRYVCDGKMIVYRSRNGGKKWEKLTKGLPQKHVYSQVLRHGMTTDALDGVYFGTNNGEVYYSRNGGDKWEVLQANLPGVLSVHSSKDHHHA
jgi:photosystem II stability/assembly factor-like uncharacterized protein